ncbi:hypothetical protein KFE25_001907 [Diacronema lutheri]|uniref:Uncharacterized protein n=1 Tax=Diacronema lutheri TaxID=2081491 RepID=A0A8J5XCD4_DIALT|nr:hypothetical protein KFE25_001907 [Diacronema lutheri]
MRGAILLLLGGFATLSTRRPAVRHVLRSSVSPPAVPTVPSPAASTVKQEDGAPFFNSNGPHDDDERKRQTEFRLNVGKVIDTLQTDYPVLFEQSPDFSIFESCIELTDPSGVSIRGLSMYRSCFTLLRLMRYTMASAEMKCKVCYAGWDPYKVRVRWNLAFSSALSPGRTYFIDGVSAYTLSERGLVRRHSLDNIIVNGREVEQPFLTWINPLSRRGALPVPTLFRPLVGSLRAAARPRPLALPTTFRASARASRDEDDAKRDTAKKQPSRPLFRPKADLEFCEETFDCEYPLFCCDLLLAKVCCSNGAFAPVPQSIPIPIPVEPDVWSR